jgi:hypothetical protein
MKRVFVMSIFIMTFAALLIMMAPNASAWERYHDPNQNDKGYCADCHPGFTGGTSDTLHALHTKGTDPVTTNCNLCHTNSGRDNPLIMWSEGDNNDGLGCTGCHGRDYGEKIAANYGGFPTNGLAKASGYGLRKHHLNKGITDCLACHPDVNQSFIKLEYVNPPYYVRSDVMLGGEPVYAADNEDSANDSNAFGLDNDGDLLYDANDPDCSLTVDTHIAKENTGGSVNFTLNAGPTLANRKYLMLGSITGTSPGTPLPGGQATLPINWDIFTGLVVSLLNTPVFQSFTGNLNGSGLGNAQMNLGPVPGAAGLTMYFAFALNNPWDFASNPAPIQIVP